MRERLWSLEVDPGSLTTAWQCVWIVSLRLCGCALRHLGLRECSEKNAGELYAYIFFYSGKTLRVHIFLFAGENYIRGIEHILFFFLFAGDNYIRGFPFFTFFTFFCEKKF